MSLEEFAAHLNSFFFLEEFTFANTTFKPNASVQFELADGLISLDKLAIVFQMKERLPTVSVGGNDKWFDDKVLKKATKQIRDTLKYLDENKIILAANNRGQQVKLCRDQIDTLHKVVLYSENERSGDRPKFHQSRSAGFIHLLALEDYTGVVRTLCTLAELSEYFTWRENQLSRWAGANALPEQALVGHFLSGHQDSEPSIADIAFVLTFEQKIEEWDITGIPGRFLERSYDGITDTRYHRIIGEIAKMNRAALKIFKDRFRLSMEKARENSFTLPYRFSMPSTGCAFVFIPLEQENRENRRIALENFTQAQKYDAKADRCVGIVVLADPDGWFTIDWCFIDAPWEHDEEMEKRLSTINPFRPTTEARIDRYTFSIPGAE